MPFEQWMARVRPEDVVGEGTWYELAAAYRAGFDERESSDLGDYKSGYKEGKKFGIALAHKNLGTPPDLDALQVKVNALVNKLNEIQDHPEYKAVWDMAYSHGIRYKGPDYFGELAAVEVALESKDETASH